MRSPRAQSWWLDDYALFRALHARHDERPWTEWPEPLARADAACGDEARGALRLGDHLPLVPAVARRRAVGRGASGCAWPVRVFGDLPFMISADSPDVWARQRRVPLRRHHRRAARRVQRDRTGLGPAAVARAT